MPIPASTPATKPAEAEKTFPDLWLDTIVIQSRKEVGVPQGTVNISARYYNEETGEMAPVELGGEQIDTQELFVAIDEIPEMAQAFGAILAAAPKLREWIAARNAAQQGE